MSNWSVYLSGEIHTDWREQITKGTKEEGQNEKAWDNADACCKKVIPEMDFCQTHAKIQVRERGIQ